MITAFLVGGVTLIWTRALTRDFTFCTRNTSFDFFHTRFDIPPRYLIISHTIFDMSCGIWTICTQSVELSFRNRHAVAAVMMMNFTSSIILKHVHVTIRLNSDSEHRDETRQKAEEGIATDEGMSDRTHHLLIFTPFATVPHTSFIDFYLVLFLSFSLLKLSYEEECFNCVQAPSEQSIHIGGGEGGGRSLLP
jgi:hypothetical protein